MAAALVASVTVAGLSGCSEEYVAPPPPTTADVTDSAAATATLDALRSAVEDGDAASARALGAEASASALLGDVATNADALDLDDVTFDYVTETGRTSGDDGWDAEVTVTWRLAGLDTAPARVELPVSFADGGASIAALGGANGRLPLWLTGPVAVRRSAEALVLSARGDADAGRTHRRAVRAVAQVREVLGDTSPLLVEVPADGEALHRALGAEPGAYASIAAITATVDGGQAPDTPVHVFLNPPVADDLDDLAAQVVMTHEAVHALTGAALDRQAPLWLVEGFADHVALREVDLPVSRTAGQVIAQVRRDGVPDALPADADFSPSTGHLGASYEAAWQVCETLLGARDEETLVAFYDAVLDGQDAAGALSQFYGWSEADLRRAWQDRLAALAG